MRMPLGLVMLIAVGGIAVGLTRMAAAEPAESPAAELAQTLATWEAQLRPFHAEYRCRSPETVRKYAVGLPADQAAQCYHDYAIGFGPAGAWRMESTRYWTGEFQGGTLLGSDGRFRYRSDREPRHAGQPYGDSVRMRRIESDEPPPRPEGPPFFGIGVWNRDASFGVWLRVRAAGSRWEKEAADSGDRVLMVPVDGDAEPLQITVDAEHGGLPRRIAQVETELWRCDEWYELRPGVWFPSKGRYRALEQEFPWDFEMRQIDTGDQVTASMFHFPAVPEQTRVTWMDEERLNPVAGPTGAAAEPPNTWSAWDWTGFVLLTGVLLAALVWRIWR